MKKAFNMKVDGVAVINVRHKDGSVETFEKHNTIVDQGFDFICKAIAVGNISLMDRIAVGSGTASTAANMKTLGNQIASKSAVVTHVNSTNVVSLTTEFIEGEAVGALTEAGVFNADGVMLDRITFKVINIDSDDRIEFTFRFTFTN